MVYMPLFYAQPALSRLRLQAYYNLPIEAARAIP